jgi:site-specific DNA recombinase
MNSYQSKTMTDTKYAASLMRVSGQEQAEEGFSLESQQGITRAYAKIHGIHIVGEFIDPGVTGTTDDRPGLQAMMRAARAHQFSILLVSKTDRLMRDTRLMLNVLHELEGLGITVYVVQDGVDTSTPMGKMWLTMLGSFAELEGKRLGQRIRDTRALRKSQGKWSSGRRLFGHGWNKETRELAINPLEAASVRFIFDQYINENVGTIRLAQICNEKELIAPTSRAGIRRPKGLWTDGLVNHILHHPAYKGGETPEWPFKAPVIIQPDMWERAQIKSQNNLHFRARKGTEPSIWRGLLRCDQCHRTLLRGYSHGITGTEVWSCPGRLKRYHMDGSDRCDLPRTPAEGLERRVETAAVLMFNNPKRLIQLVDKTINELVTEKMKLERTIAPITGDVKRQEELMDQADTMFKARRMAKDTYNATIAGARKRIAELEKQIVAADPMQLLKVKELEKSIQNWEVMKSDRFISFMYPAEDLEALVKLAAAKYKPNTAATATVRPDAPVLTIEDFKDAGSFIPEPEVLNDPRVAVKQLRKLGLFVYVGKRKVEIKGSLAIDFSVSSNQQTTLPLGSSRKYSSRESSLPCQPRRGT